MLSCGVSPGFSRLLPNSSLMLQFTCLPDPLTPAKGFSCSRQARPNLGAIRLSASIVIIWWSVATLAFSNSGATSYWLGATSLCRVFTGTPHLYSSFSTSIMHASTRSGMEPKYWSSISWPFGGRAPNRVRPALIRSGLER